MLGSLHTRFRVVLVLLAFGMGLAAGPLSDDAMASQMQASMQEGLGTGHPCPSCPDAGRTGMMPGCALMTACWTAPALPAQPIAVQEQPAAIFPEGADLRIAGIALSPDPHPPRSLLHA